MLGDKKPLSKSQKIYIEGILFERSQTEENIENLKCQILHGQPHRDVVPGAGYIADPTARKAVNLVANRWLVRSQAELEAVDRALSKLQQKHHHIYVWKYRRGERSWDRISDEVGYEKRQCYRIRDEILLTIARELGMIGD